MATFNQLGRVALHALKINKNTNRIETHGYALALLGRTRERCHHKTGEPLRFYAAQEDNAGGHVLENDTQKVAHFKRPRNLLRSVVKVGISATLVLLGYYYLKDTRATIHSLVPLVFRCVDPELSHELVVWLGEKGLLPIEHTATPDVLHTKVWDIDFDSPIGLAAGFDKNGRAIDSLAALGFGFVEIGSVTPLPQPGNDKPRVFRIVQDKAIINRYGFNSHGADAVHASLLCRHMDAANAARHSDCFSYQLKEKLFDLPGTARRCQKAPPLVGINLGKNKTTSEESAVNDYLQGLDKLGLFADYIVINVSSPNTPGLRNLQAKDKLIPLLASVIERRNKMDSDTGALKNTTGKLPPVLVKISPDIDESQLDEVLIAARTARIDGMIVSNTTVSRPAHPADAAYSETGGLSGQPLLNASTRLLCQVYQKTQGQMPLIASGGVMTAEDVFEKLKNGASLVQVYTGLVYGGAGLVTQIKADLARLMQKEGYETLRDVIGVSAKSP